MPSHKRNPNNPGLQVAFVVYIPEKFAHLRPDDYVAGGSSDRLVSFIDFAPTLLRLVGITPPAWMQGHAFLGEHITPPLRICSDSVAAWMNAPTSSAPSPMVATSTCVTFVPTFPPSNTWTTRFKPLPRNAGSTCSKPANSTPFNPLFDSPLLLSSSTIWKTILTKPTTSPTLTLIRPFETDSPTP
ncbi:MAG: hypothetical protein J6386_08575 [Candidatus Synoicihabitans palmerolidicus]|nr:hypothetical protein [Candidatus Synoicihabitans palmerolidicus]